MILKGFYEAAMIGNKSYLGVENQTGNAGIFVK